MFPYHRNENYVWYTYLLLHESVFVIHGQGIRHGTIGFDFSTTFCAEVAGGFRCFFSLEIYESQFSTKKKMLGYLYGNSMVTMINIEMLIGI